MDTLAEDIVRSGATHVFGIPGSGASLSLIDEVSRCGVRFSLGYHEASCIIIAAAYGAVSHTPAIAFSIKGPGVANSVPGLAAMKLEDMPVVAISEAATRLSVQKSVHKKMSHYHLTREVVKARVTCDGGLHSFRNAWQLADSEIPGPVLFDLINATDDIDETRQRSRATDRAQPSSSEERDVIAAIKASSRPVLIVGSLCARMPSVPTLKNLRIPIFTTLAAKGVFDEYSTYAAGIYTGVGRENAPETKILEHCDLVVGIGLRAKELLGYPRSRNPMINIDLSSPLPLQEYGGFIPGEMANLSSYIHELERKNWGEKEISSAVSDMRQALLSKDFLPATVFHLLKEKFPQCRLISDTGLFCTVAEHLWQARTYRSFLCASNGRYMGTSVPMGIGASLADQDSPTVIAVGDGGIGMYLSELRIAVEEQLPVLVLLLSDGGYGSVQAAARGKGIDLGLVNIRNSSWQRVFSSLGLEGENATSLTSVSNFLDTWDWRNGPAFLECRFEPASYGKMIDGLR